MTLGVDPGQREADRQVFPFDRRFPEFRANKLAARCGALGRYVIADGDGFTAPVRAAALSRIRGRLLDESPHLFAADGEALSCALTGERIIIDADGALDAVESRVLPHYLDAFDALCCQVCEDIVVVRRTPERGDAVVALHVCAPSGWAPAEKIGLSFDALHRVVPGMERVRAASAGLVRAMIEQPSPTVRFNWGIQFGDDRLNAHPLTTLPASQVTQGPAYLRIERQILLGMPEVDAALFTIRVIHTPLAEIRVDPGRRAALRSALLSMSPETRRYKGLAGDCFEDALSQIQGP
jgi:hypothetical protein